MKPLGVWSDNVVQGTVLLCFLAQTMPVARYDIPEIRSRSTKFIIASLENSTVACVYDIRHLLRRSFLRKPPLPFPSPESLSEPPNIWPDVMNRSSGSSYSPPVCACRHGCKNSLLREQLISRINRFGTGNRKVPECCGRL
jgi:hypothetical protein